MDQLSDRLARLSPEQLAELMRRARGPGATEAPAARIQRRSLGDVPLSFAQQRLWFVQQLDPASVAYNMVGVTRLEGELDASALQRALDIVVERHEALRTVLVAGDGEPVQRVVGGMRVVLATENLAGTADEDWDAEIQGRACREQGRPFDLSAGPLMRAVLLRLDARRHALVMCMHHVISDGWSRGVIVREISALYTALVRGDAPHLPPLPVQYPDYALWQRERMQGDLLAAQLGYWTKQLADAPPALALPTDHPRPAVQSFAGASHRFHVSADVAEALRELARAEGSSLFMVLLAAFKTLLARYTGQPDLVVGTPVANRGRGETEGLVGFFANTLALRTDLAGAPTFREALRRVRETALGAYAHEELPFERLVEELGGERSLARNLVFQVMFLLNESPARPFRLPGLDLVPVEVDAGTSMFDLTLAFETADDGLAGKLEYATALFDAATAARMAEHLGVLLGAAAANPDARIADLPLMTAAEHALLRRWNATERGYPNDALVHELFAAQAARTPGAPALVFRGQPLSYAEVEARSNRLAHHLRRRGAGPEARVGVCLERAPELVISLLAVLKSGGAYVPLDPAYPPERLGWMVDDADARLVVTTTALADRLPASAHAVHVDALADALAAEPEDAPRCDASAENLSHVIFTSGSTGRPKGVMIRHGSTATLLHWMRENVTDAERASVLASTSTSFDVSVAEIFGALCWGGTLVLVENALNLPSVADREIRYASMVPTAAAELLRSGGIPASVRTLNLAGEPLPNDLAQALYALGTVEKVGNLYGPTEDTSYSTYARVERGADRVLIGRPLAETRAHVLDAALRPVPVGVIGDLYLAGGGLARGYQARPGLTAERFIPDPSGLSGARMYATHDRVRWTAEGELEYFGRSDFQVKVRGFRIELGEIEAALRAHAAVADAVAVVREDAGDRRIVAYLVAVEGADAPPAAELRAALKQRLPGYMVPAAFVSIDAFPRTGSGKIDRNALPAPDAALVDAGERVAPRTPAEELLAGIFADVLGAGDVGVHDDFFALGGHSLLATRVAARVRRAFGIDLPVREVFSAPTVAALAARIESLRGDAQPDAAPIPPAPRDGPLPLSSAQRRLWHLHRRDPADASYNVAFALRLRGAVDAGVLERGLAEVVRRHESLRTTFAADGEEPAQVVHPSADVRIARADLRQLPEDEREERARRLAAEQALAPFDLAAGPLLRGTLVRLSDDGHALLFAMHHVVSDGWSMGVLVREVSALYDAFSRGEPSPLGELPVQYADYAAWESARLAGDALAPRLAWWRRELAGAPPLLEIPTDRPRPRVASAAGAREAFVLRAETVAALRALSRRDGATLFMTLLAAWQLLLSRYSGQADVPVGTPVAGRDRVELEGLIGLFVNTIVLRGDLAGNPDFRALLGRVRQAALGAYAHQDVPFDRLVEALAPGAPRGHTPLFQVMFALQGDAPAALRLGDAHVESVEADAQTARFDLSLALAPDGDALAGGLTYRPDLFDAATARRMLAHYATLLDAIAADATLPISRYSLLDAAERHRVLAEWNATDADAPAEACIHERFAAQAARTPHAAAVVYGAESLTYAELDAASSRLANHLRARGAGVESRVALCLERGTGLVVAILAALKAGAAYLPLDPSHPAGRLLQVLEDADARVLVTRGAASERVGGFAGAVVRLDADAARIATESADAPASGAGPDNLAYLIYTSGSTGRPKGVMVRHRAVVNLHAALDRGLYSRRAAAAPPRVSVNGPASFDTSVKQIVQLLGGATLCIVPESARYDADALGAWLREHRVQVLDCTPAQLRHLLADGLLAKAGPALTDLLVAGEAIDPALWATLAALDGVRAWNLYGPTECTVDAALCRVAGTRPVLGGPVANARLYVLDAEWSPVPAGVPGELFVGGAGVARGYAGQPGLTAGRFVPDPFGGEPGARLYRTGDRVRWTPAGELEYLGRTDHQVKVRGFRLEPGEIEAALQSHPSVRQAVVAAVEDAAGERRLAGYVVAVAGAEIDLEAVRAHLRQRLPDYMVPQALVVLDRLPLSHNGKLDRAALPAPLFESPGAEYVAPLPGAEELIAAIFARVLNVPRVGATDDFFALGGHSLLAGRVASRIRAELGVELPLRTVFESPTARALAAAVAELRGGAGQEPPLVPVARGGALPLSFAQQRLWFLDQLEPGGAAYNLPYALRLRGALDVAALAASLTELARRHETLRTRFPRVAGEPVQVVDDAATVHLPFIDLTQLPEDAREPKLAEIAAAGARAPFDLAAGPLLRAALVQLGAADHALLLEMHHIISDGWSTGVMARELSALYAAFSAGEDPHLPDLPVQYADFAAWQRAWLSGDTLAAQLGFWRDALAGAPPLLDLPTDRPRPRIPSDAAGSVPFIIPAHTVRSLRSLSRDEGATPFMALLAGWQALLSRYSGQADVSVGTPVAGRTRLETEALVGCFVNTLVMRTDLSGAPGFRALLRRVRERTLAAWQHQDVPFERLVEELAPERSLGHTPLFQVLFTVESDAREPLRLGSVFAEVMEPAQAAAKFDLALHLAPDGEALAGSLAYRAELFDAATAERMAVHFAALLAAAVAEPDRPVAALPMMAEGERRRVVSEWNATDSPFAADVPVHRLIAAQAGRTPDAAAVVCGGETLTYAELDAGANRLARHLRRLGMGPEVRAGVCLERTPQMLVALLGVLKAGGAYVPLDPAHPAARLRFALEDADARVVLAQASTLASVESAGIPVVRMDADAAAMAAESDAELDGGAAQGNLAYVIYTSGSTGRPKGVQVEHRTVSALLHWLRGAVADEDAAVVLASTSITFDVSVAELFGTLARGGTLVLVRNALDLASLPADAGARLGWMVPGAAAELLRLGALPGTIRTLNLAGEALPASLVHALHDAGVARVVNLYGPTESTVYATAGEVARGAERVTIGRPVPNTRVYVLDAGMSPVPAGVPGELFIAGAQVARGYLGRPALTAERFVPDPFSAEGARLYRTGDRVRWTAQGEVEYLGRLDFQVKVRGFRIELGEIEAALREQPGVGDVVVVVRDDAAGERRIVAYLTADGAAPDADALRSALRERLPEYMLPSAFVVMDALPVGTSGKVDRAALPAADLAADAGEHVAPRTSVEALLAGIFAEVLGAERVGITHDFFRLGGHSLLATRVVSRVREALGIDLPLRALFEAPTVQALAERCERLARAGAAPSAPPLVPVPRDAPLPLSFAQQRLWFIHQLDPAGAAYHMPYALRLRGALDRRALERSLTVLVARHEALRTRFPVVDGEPVQVVDDAVRARVAWVDLAALPSAERERTLRELAAVEARRPFDLAAGPLMRATLVRLGDEDHAVLLTLHHAVSDGWSMGVLVREMGELYAAFAAGREPHLPHLPVQYADYAVWQRAWLSGDVLAAQLAFWRQALAGAPPLLELPLDRPRPAVPGDAAARVEVAIPADAAEALRALARDAGATVFMALLAGLQLLLARHAGQDDVVVGSPVANRTRLETEGLIGFFANTLALRTDLSGDPTVRELLARVREVVLRAEAHQDLPFERLVEELHPDRSLRHSPIFQVLFVFAHGEPAPPAMGGVRAEPLDAGADSARFDLQVTLADAGAGEGIRGSIIYRTELWDAATVERMAAHLTLALEGMAARPGERISRISLLRGDERRRVVEEWNATEADYPRHLCMHHLFEASARLTPDAPAVVFDGGSLSYAELDRRSNRLARHLRGRGVGPDARVGICLERGPEMMVAVLGVMKAGGACVPVDPAYPAERMAVMLEDADAPVLVTQGALAGRLPASAAAVVSVDGDADSIAAESDAPVAGGALPDHLAYVIYTSGSTGRPKGVAMPHRPLVSLLAWQARQWKHPRAAATLQFTTLSFDVSFQEIFSCWASGGRLVLLAEHERRDLGAVVDRLEEHGIERLFLPYVALQHVAEQAEERGAALSTLREVQTAGEQLRITPAIRRLFERTGATLANQYGPSETHVATALVVEGDPPAWPALPGIGGPVANARCHVLDAAGEPAPVGVPGELYLGGECLARGYLHRPALTAERFVPDPFSAGARLYRTGDRARRLADGTLEFLGRLDDQVKVRGFRVEPGEVEAALEAHPSVREAVVIVREDAPGDRRLVGYVVPSPDAQVSATELRAHLKAHLPEYMVPSAFVALEAFPLTPSGKVARRALPAPEADATADDFVAPRTPAEEIVAGIFAQVLGAARVGAEDDFFALGGHSLLATQVATRVRAAFGAELPLRVFFQAPTAAAVAAWLDGRRAAPERDAAPIARVAIPGEWLPLSFAQQRLWLVNQMDPESRVYNQLLGFRLSGRLHRAALARALGELVRRHAVFRTRFEERDGVPGQVIAAAAPLPLPLIDLTGIDDPEAALRDIAREHGRRLFDLGSGELLRVLLVRLAPGEHALLAAMHHITNDGWSAAIMFREVAALYDAFSRGLPSPLAEPAIQYADYAVWQRAWLTPEREAEQLAFWRRQLDALPALHLAGDRAGEGGGTDGQTRTFTLSPDLSEGVRRLSRSLGATPFMTLLAAFKVLLHWQARGSAEVVVGTDIANRNLRAETEGVIGFFVNQLVLRTRIEGVADFAELVARVRQVTLDAYDHQDVPFDRVVEALQPRRAPGETPFFRTKFMLQNAPAAGAAELPGLVLETMPAERTAAQLDVLLAMHDAGDRMEGLFEYRTSLFSPELIDRWIGCLGAVLERAVEDTAVPMEALLAELDERESQARQSAQDALKAKRRARFAR